MEFLHFLHGNIDRYLSSPLVLDLIEQVLTHLEDIGHQVYPEIVTITAPIFLKCLICQMSDQPNEDYHVDKAGGTGLSLLAETSQSLLYGLVEPFIVTNLTSSDWRLKDASITAFGALIGTQWQHPQTANLIQGALPILLSSLENSPHPLVRVSSAWAIGQIFSGKADLLHLHLAPALSSISATFSLALCDPNSQVQEQVWNAIMKIASCAQDQPESFPPSLLGDLVFPLIQRIFHLTDPNVSSGFHSSREMAFLAAASLIEIIPPTSHQELHVLLVEIIRRLQLSLVHSSSTEILYLCPLLFSFLTALPAELLSQSQADTLTNILFQVCSGSMPEAQAEALLSFAKFISLCPEVIERHAPAMVAMVLRHLDSDVTMELLYFIGDLSRGLDANMTPLLSQLIPRLLGTLRNPLHRLTGLLLLSLISCPLLQKSPGICPVCIG
jgi:hypothetical protein